MSHSKRPAKNQTLPHARLVRKVARGVRTSEDGTTGVEYACMVALIIIVCISGIQCLGASANVSFSTVSTSVGS
jgi:Flp pilus assembly pilin Flp